MQLLEEAPMVVGAHLSTRGGAKAVLVFSCAMSAGWLSAIAEVEAQTVAQPVTRQEVTQEEIAGPQAATPLYVLPPQSYMREIRWSDITGRDLSDVPPA